MKKFKNIVLGGIQSKIFNLVIIFLLLTMAAYTVVILHQTNSLNTPSSPRPSPRAPRWKPCWRTICSKTWDPPSP